MTDLVESYLNELKARRLSENTIKAYKQVLTKLNDYKPLNSIVKDDLVMFFKDMKGTDATIQLYMVIAKTYFKSVGKPEIAAWLRIKKPKDKLRSDKILIASDVNAMIDATDSLYWKLLLSLLWETGGRISELLSLKYSDFIITENGLSVTIETTKTSAGFRQMLIPLSENYFYNYQNSVSHKNNDFVFNPENKKAQTVYRWAFDIIGEIGRRAHVDKPCNPHMFRHGRATQEVLDKTQESVIRKKLGWSETSTTPSRYQHLADNVIMQSQIQNGSGNNKNQIRIAEKIDVTPVFETLKEENKKLRTEMDELKNYILLWLRSEAPLELPKSIMDTKEGREQYEYDLNLIKKKKK